MRKQASLSFVRKLGAFGVVVALGMTLAACSSPKADTEPPAEEVEAVEEEPVVEKIDENAGNYPVVSSDENVYSLNYFENDEPVFDDDIKYGWSYAGAYADGMVAVKATQGSYDESWEQWDDLEPVVQIIDHEGNVLCNLNELLAKPNMKIVYIKGLGYSDGSTGGDFRIQFKDGALALEVEYRSGDVREHADYLIDENFQIVYQSSELYSLSSYGIASPHWWTRSGIIDSTGTVLLTDDDVAQQTGLDYGIGDVEIKGSHYLYDDYQNGHETVVRDFEGNVLFTSSSLATDLEYDSAEFELNSDDRTIGIVLRKGVDKRIGLYDYIAGEWSVELENPEETGIIGFTSLDGQTFKLVDSGNPDYDLYTIDGELIAEDVFWSEKATSPQGGECYLLSSGNSSEINLLDLKNMTAREFPYDFTQTGNSNPWHNRPATGDVNAEAKFVTGTADYASDEAPIVESNGESNE